MGDPVRFFRERFVGLFNRGVELLDARAEGGTEQDKRLLEDIRQADGVAWLRFGALGDVWLQIEGGCMMSSVEPPSAGPIRLALSIPAEPAASWVGELLQQADVDGDEAALRAARVASRRFQRAVGDEPLEFHFVIEETPEFEQVVIRVGLQAAEPPEQPPFTATVRWQDLETMRAGGLDPQQILLSGRVRLAGDYSRAMAVGAEMMRNP